MGSRSLPKNNEIVSATAYEKPPLPPPKGGGGKIWLNSYTKIKKIAPAICFSQLFMLLIQSEVWLLRF